MCLILVKLIIIIFLITIDYFMARFPKLSRHQLRSKAMASPVKRV